MTVEAQFELFEVTADVGVAARGPTVEATFEQAALGMYAVMVDLDTVRATTQREVTLGPASTERQLERWLLELLYLTESEDLLFADFEVDLDVEGALRGLARGEPIDHERHALGVEVKAVTRHQLAIEAMNGGYQARVIFDI